MMGRRSGAGRPTSGDPQDDLAEHVAAFQLRSSARPISERDFGVDDRADEAAGHFCMASAMFSIDSRTNQQL